MQHFDKNIFKSKEKLKTLVQKKSISGDPSFNIYLSSFYGLVTVHGVKM